MEFESLKTKFETKLRAIARRLDGKYTAFDDDDLYQEGLLHLWTELQKGTWPDKTDSFIVQGCSFAMKNYIRRNHKSLDRHSCSLHEPVDDAGNTREYFLPAPAHAPGREEREIAVSFAELKEKLSPRERDVLEWRRQGMTVREIGARLRVSHVMAVRIAKRIRRKWAELDRMPDEF